MNKSLKKKVASLEKFLAENKGLSSLTSLDLNTEGAMGFLNTDSLLVSLFDLPEGKSVGILKEFNDLKGKVSGMDSSRITTGLNGLLSKLKAQKPDLDSASFFPFLKQLVNDKLPDLNLEAWSKISQGKLAEVRKWTGAPKDKLAGLASQKADLASGVPGKSDLNFERISGLVDIKELAFLSDMKGEIAMLKDKLEVGKGLFQGNAKVTTKLQESMMELTDMEYELGDLQGIKSQLTGVKLDSSMMRKYLGPVGENLEQIKGEVGGYQQLMDEYKGQLVDWDKTLEHEIMKLEEVQGLKKYVEQPMPDPKKQVEEAQKTIDKGFQSKEYVNGLIQERFAKLLEEEGPDALIKRLEGGHEKLAKYKEKYQELQTIDAPPPRPENPLKGKSLGERLVFGGNLQINRQKPLTMDAGLEVAYQLNPKSEWG